MCSQPVTRVCSLNFGIFLLLGGGVSKVCCRDLEDIVADLPIGNRIRRRSSLLASDGDVTSRCRSRRRRPRSPGGQCAVVVSSQMIEVNAERTEMMKAIPVFIAVLDKIWGFADIRPTVVFLCQGCAHILYMICKKSYEL